MSFASVFSRFRPVRRHRVSARTTPSASRSSAAFCTLILGTAAACLPGALHAQAPGSLDTTFTSALTGATIFALSTAYVGKNADENIIAAGDTTALTVEDGTGLNFGNFTSPVFGGGARIVYTVVPDLRNTQDPNNPLLLFGGSFGKSEPNKTVLPAQNITRITLLGAIDSTFQPGVGANDFVTSILPLTDVNNTIMVGGLFTSFNKTAYPHLVRLQKDGSIDTDFASVAVNDGVFALAPQLVPSTGLPDPDNEQFLVGGTFTAIGSTAYTRLARIDSHGSVDSSFKPTVDGQVFTIATQPDGKIIIGGQFASVNGQAATHLARLNQDGSLDTTFSASVNIVPSGTSAPVAVYILKLLPDGRIYVGGNFSAADGVKREYLARLETDGSLDTSFDPGTSIANSVQSLAIQADNRVLVGETVSKKINDVFPPSLIRLYGDPVTAVAAVSLTATKPGAREGTSATRVNGKFALTRTGGDPTVPLTVYFTVAGSAQSGAAYKRLAATQVSGNIYQATFAANQTTLVLKVKPLDNVLSDAPESLTLTLLPSQNTAALYDLGPDLPTSGTVSISNAL